MSRYGGSRNDFMKEVKKPELTKAQKEKGLKESFKRELNKDKEIKK